MSNRYIFSATILLPAAVAAQERPNVILIMTDQQRGDCIGVVNDKIITPNIDAISGDGVTFTNGYVASPSSTPARSVLLTGMTPWHTGMIGYNGKVAERYQHEYPRIMTEVGYRTIAIGKMHWFPQRNDHGFETMLLDESGRVESEGFISDYRKWFAEQAPGEDPDLTGIGWNAHQGRVYQLAEELHPTRWTGDMAVEQIEAYDGEKPLCLKVSFARPHSPYDPPQRYYDMYEGVDIPEPYIGEWCDRYADREMTESAPYGDFGTEHALESRRCYYAAITFIDDEIGRIIEALKEKGIYDNSIIIFTSDHGDMLGDHHHWRKTYPYEGSVHIPYIVKFVDSLAAGNWSDRCVDLRDVMPTFLDAAGVQIPSNVDGSTLLPFAESVAPRGWREYIEMEHSGCYEPGSGWVALTDGKTKYVWWYNRGEESLFDLTKDREEIIDLSSTDQRAKDLELWRARMVETLEERGEEWVKDGQLVKNNVTSPLNSNYPITE